MLNKAASGVTKTYYEVLQTIKAIDDELSANICNSTAQKYDPIYVSTANELKRSGALYLKSSVALRDPLRCNMMIGRDKSSQSPLLRS